MLDVERMPQRIGIGRETETGVTDIEIDVSAWRRKWPGLTISAMHKPQGGSPYVLDTELQGDTLVWHVSDADTASAVEGQMEIIGTAEGVRKLSCVVGVVVTGRMPGTVGDAPEAAKPWADKVLAAAESVRSSAEDARESAGSAQAYAEAAQESAEGVVTAEAERVQAEQARVQAEQARQEAEKAREEVLPSKLTEPSSGLAVGKYFRVAAIDENGHAVLEAVDAPVGGLSTEPSLWPLWTSDEQAAARERIGIPGDYELLEESVFEETVSYMSRNKDNQGNSYYLDAIMIYLETKPDESNGSGRCAVYSDNGYVSDTFLSHLNHAKGSISSVKVYRLNGCWNSMARNTQNDLSSTTGYANLMNGYVKPIINSGHIRSFYISGKIVAGSKLMIWGVRA